jgi:glycosyltransferase involved in cell wall biosynthesis
LKIENDLKNSEISICVVIATRNRAEMLCKLLESIEDNEVKPDQISIVSSGEEIANIITKFNKNLNIIHNHTSQLGQVLQRSMALENLIKAYDAYVFLDDDVTVDKNFFLELGSYLNLCDEQVGGVGLNLESQSSKREKTKVLNKLKKFILNDYMAGRVLKSGRNTKYSGLDSIKQVSWLNGLSVWTHLVISKFNHVAMENRYAAAEDLIFSYKVGKSYKLFYNPELVVYEQSDVEGIRPNLDVYRTSWQHKLYFVLTNKELKFWAFILDNFINICTLSISAFKRHPRIKMKIIFYNLRFVYIVIKNKYELNNNTRYQNNLLNRIM